MSPTLDDDWVRRIHETPLRFVLAVTGGGSEAIGRLLRVPGASRSVLEAIVPYAAAALSDFLGARPEEFCSGRTARAMAMCAYQRAKSLAAAEGLDTPLAGIGCTAGLHTDRPKRGSERVHLAVQTAQSTVAQSIVFEKSARSRGQQEAIVANLILALAGEACGLPAELAWPWLPGENLETARCHAPPPWQELLAGQQQRVGQSVPALPAGRQAVFPGAFNPLHDGHRRMRGIAQQMLGAPVCYEISILNVDKPPLDFLEMQARGAQFRPDEPLWWSRAATFLEKSAVFPDATFIVGADTIVRIGDPKYYGDDPAACREAIAGIAHRGGQFLVFGRTVEGRFQTLDDLPLPAELRALCRQVPAEQFHMDVSSTQLRQATHQDD